MNSQILRFAIERYIDGGWFEVKAFRGLENAQIEFEKRTADVKSSRIDCPPIRLVKVTCVTTISRVEICRSGTEGTAP